MDKGEIRNFLLLVGGLLLVLALSWVFDAFAEQHELGWLAQRQMQARQDCAELIKYKLQW